MKFLIIGGLLAVAAAGRLENTYLPPSSAGASGGSPSFLAAPFRPPSTHKITAPSGPVNTYTGSGNSPVPILKFNNDNAGLGTYKFDYETGNGIVQEESGQLQSNGWHSVQGSYSYTAPDGVTYTVNYVADQNGFRATGAHIPH